MLFQLGFALTYFPLPCHMPCFDRKVLPLLSSACFFKVRDPLSTAHSCAAHAPGLVLRVGHLVPSGRLTVHGTPVPGVPDGVVCPSSRVGVWPVPSSRPALSRSRDSCPD